MKVLCVHATAGAGHMKAAEAVYNGLKKESDVDPAFIDALDYTSPIFKKMYRGTYSFMVAHMPTVWAAAFAVIDIPSLQGIVRFGRRIYNGLNSKKFEQYLIKEKFDCIISSQFFSTEIMASLKRRGLISSKLITVVTDYDVHRIWVAKGIDQYAVASEWTKLKLASLGVPEDKIYVSGIPVDEKFTRQPDIKELKKSFGLRENAFTVLIATGSFGIGPIEDVARQLEGFQVIVICGHNKKLYEKLTKAALPDVHVKGLVDNMHELMAVSDVMVTKPGGLSITEAMVSQLPLIFFHPIPGQETNNIRVLTKHGIGTAKCSISRIVANVKELRDSHDAYLTALRRTKALARPGAVQDIIKLVRSV